MKKKLKNLRKSNFIQKFDLFFSNIKPIKLSNFKAIISIYVIIFSFFLFLSLPGLFDYEKYHEQIKKKTFADFKIHIENIDKIKYRFVPFPHLLIEEAEIKFSKEEASKIAQLKKLQIYISIFELYKYKKISIKKLVFKETNFYFNKETFTLFDQHLNNTIIKPIEIINSNFFFTNKQDEVVTISPIQKINYFIDLKSKEKKLKIKGKLFGTNYKLNWNKSYLNPKIINFSIFFKKPSIQITNKILHEKDKNFQSGNLTISVLGKESNFKYLKKDSSINFKNLKDNSSDFVFNGNVDFNPFNFNLSLLIKDRTLNFVIENLYLKYYEFRNSINSNFTGKLNIELEDIKSNFIESLILNLDFKDSEINIEKNSLKIKKIGNIIIKNPVFVEKNDKLLFKSKIIFNIKNQDEFYRKFSITKKHRINLNKIFLQFEKEIGNDVFWISNIHYNKEKNEVDDQTVIEKDKYKFSNVQQLRNFLQEEFKKISLD
tara:strand:- start:4170 stop:5633 length:1464 start_codon:yes stop_codon:yes gene_type:complete